MPERDGLAGRAGVAVAARFGVAVGRDWGELASVAVSTPQELRCAGASGSSSKGAVGDCHLARMAEGGNRAFEPALADITPRAHHVRPDLHIHGSSNLRDNGVIPSQAAPESASDLRCWESPRM